MSGEAAKGKTVLLGFGAVLVAMVGTITIYIPHYSSFEPAKARREEYNRTGNIVFPTEAGTKDGAGTKAPHAPGSVYRNMDRNAKGAKRI